MTKEPQPNRDALAASLLPMVLKFHPELVGFGRKAAEVAYIYADGLLWASRSKKFNFRDPGLLTSSANGAIL